LGKPVPTVGLSRPQREAIARRVGQKSLPGLWLDWRVAVSRSVRQGFLWSAWPSRSLAWRRWPRHREQALKRPKCGWGAFGEVTVGGVPFTVDVLVENVVNLGAFEFTLGYDASVSIRQRREE